MLVQKAWIQQKLLVQLKKCLQQARSLIKSFKIPMNLIEHFIDGRTVKGSSKRKSKVFNPATGEQASEVNLASKQDVDLAVEKAKKAFINWSKKPPAQRAKIIFKFIHPMWNNSNERGKRVSIPDAPVAAWENVNLFDY